MNRSGGRAENRRPFRGLQQKGENIRKQKSGVHGVLCSKQTNKCGPSLEPRLASNYHFVLTVTVQMVTGTWSLVAGRWPRVPGHWPLVPGPDDKVRGGQGPMQLNVVGWLAALHHTSGPSLVTDRWSDFCCSRLPSDTWGSHEINAFVISLGAINSWMQRWPGALWLTHG